MALWIKILPLAAAALDASLILVFTGLISFVYEFELFAINDMTFGALIATMFLGTNVARNNYAVSTYLLPKGQMRRAVQSWSIAFLAAITFGFMTKTGEFFSRGMAVLVFSIGLAVVVPARVALSKILMRQAQRGMLLARTIFLVGDEFSVGDFASRFDFEALGLRLAGAAVVRPEQDHLDDDLALAAASARMLRPHDIFILAPWSDRDFLTRCIDRFLRLPATIHIGPEPMLQQFANMQVVRNGPMTTVHLVRSPLSPLEVSIKRCFDLVVSVAVLALLLPLLVLLSIAIKLDSPGPILFRQTRYGFNQEPFRIFKFRTMTTMEDGAAVRQATRGDARITRLGGWLRRSNLDELPQLLNVIWGDMSLVGPRPHAMAHDQAFERSVSLYARRHNVRPGITGWAQVNGWRGETDTAEKIKGRVEYDLFYVDNWSLWLDIVVLARTLLSPRAYLNAQ